MAESNESLIVPVTNVPIVESDRLKLRGHRLEDFADCVAMWSDPVVTKFIGGKPSPPQQTWARLLAYIGHWSVLHFGYWAIEEKATGRFIGEIGYADFKRDIAVSMKGFPELGWALAPHAHGKGYGTEAARAVVAWGDRSFRWARTVCIIDPDNLASIRIAEKCGYEVFEHALFNDKKTLFLARTARKHTNT